MDDWRLLVLGHEGRTSDPEEGCVQCLARLQGLIQGLASFAFEDASVIQLILRRYSGQTEVCLVGILR